ncbi:MAG: dihydrofolate reductase family protein [Alphaproteobacteria bacterium]
MQAPTKPDEDMSGGFKHGSWAVKSYEEVMVQVRNEAMAQPYDVLFGRKTYELFAAHFPNVSGDENADRMNNATKYVASNTLDKLDWQNSVLLKGDVASEIAKLKRQDGPLLQVHGSANLIHHSAASISASGSSFRLAKNA